ncbi:hypothetical protein BKA93DRAFT_820611 [Sparassis latifolia]
MCSNPISNETRSQSWVLFIPALSSRIQFSTPAGGGNSIEREYDYVIVGEGNAGCVRASRWSEDSDVTVLLIETGDLLTSIPLAFIKILKTATDWSYETVPEKALNERQMYWPRGKILGDSSAINALIYHHCAPEDFDEWARNGETGGSHDDLRPYLLKSEKYTPNTLFPDVKSADRGSTRPWQTGHTSDAAVRSTLIVKACESMGVPYNSDLNAARGTLGVAHFSGIVDRKVINVRSSSASTYLTRDVLSRPNLTIGVIAVRREVILSAGALASPQILLLSGVGSAVELEDVGVSLVKDLPAVGRHLSDSGFTWDHLSHPLARLMAMFKWLMFGTGPLSALGPFSGAFGCESSPVKDLTSGPGAPDIELVRSPVVFIHNGFVEPPAGLYEFTAGTIALRPESTGSIKLKSNNAWEKPLIRAEYLFSESDMNVVIRGMRFLEWRTRTLLLAEQIQLLWLGDADPEKLKEWIRTNSSSLFHPVCLWPRWLV